MFAVDVNSLCDALPPTDGAREIAKQLRRAGNGVGANYREAKRGRSVKEFTSKLGTVIEEADEAMYWLEHLAGTRIVGADIVEDLRQEADELVSIFTASQQTAQNNENEKRRAERERQTNRRRHKSRRPPDK